MTPDKEKIRQMLAQLNSLKEACRQMEAAYADQLARVHPKLRQSAVNLLHYRALRQNDIRHLQVQLGNMGLSRLGKAESHVMASILACKAILRSFIEPVCIKLPETALSMKKGNLLLDQHAKALFGYRSPDRRVRIMVTLPSEAAYNPFLVGKILEKGMNTARINCAHDGPADWLKMIEHLQAACIQQKRDCKVAMDLGGPKIRTGELAQGPEVLKIKPRRDDLGRTVQPAEVWLWPDNRQMPEEIPALPLPPSFLQQLSPNDLLRFSDTRKSKRRLKVQKIHENGAALVTCADTAYLTSGMELLLERPMGNPLIGTIGKLPPKPQHILLCIGDTLKVHRKQVPGHPAKFDANGKCLEEAAIACTSEQVFACVQMGEPVLFDDGKIKGEIVAIHPEYFRVKVLYAQEGGEKLQADKGINFPDTRLSFSGLTLKDKEDLAFIAEHAQVVNVSFVNRPEDVEELISELKKLRAEKKLGIILKIETQSGFNHLTDILVAAMQVRPIGVMIARGDLAIECGWENMARIQEEILSLCQAAHVPVVWATQVLENLAKKGIPSRAEISDAAMAQRAECVMLNKGPHITTAIKMLGYILASMQDYQRKKAPMLPVMALSGKHLEPEERVEHV